MEKLYLVYLDDSFVNTFTAEMYSLLDVWIEHKGFVSMHIVQWCNFYLENTYCKTLEMNLCKYKCFYKGLASCM